MSTRTDKDGYRTIKTRRTPADGLDVKAAISGRRYERSWRSRNKAPRVYVWPEGENLLENMANRTSRPTALYRKIAKVALAELGISGTLRWDQHAGCSMCPCSPGFVLKLDEDATLPEVDDEGRRFWPAHGFDIHIKARLPKQELTAEGADRAEQVMNDPTMPDLREYAV